MNDFLLANLVAELEDRGFEFCKYNDVEYLENHDHGLRLAQDDDGHFTLHSFRDFRSLVLEWSVNFSNTPNGMILAAVDAALENEGAAV